MVFSTSILVLVLAVDDAKLGDLVPIEQGIVDRSATATTLRIQPVELSQSTNFQKLFGVAGRPDLLVRSQGGVYAVFDQGSYRTVEGRTYVQWPAGTIYYIGQPDFGHMKGGGVRAGQSGANPPPGIQLPSKPAGGIDARVGAAPEEGLIRAVPINERIVNEPATRLTPAKVPVKDAGYGHHSADAVVPPAAPPAKKDPASQEAAQPPKDSATRSPPKP